MYRIIVATIIASLVASTTIVPYAAAITTDDTPRVLSEPQADRVVDNTENTREEPLDVQSTQQVLETKTPTQETTLPDSPHAQSATLAPEPVIVSSTNAVAGPETTPSLIVTSLAVSSTLEYLELYNQSDVAYKLETISVRATYNDTPCTLHIASNGWLLPKSFVLLSSPTAHTVAPVAFTTDCLLDGNVQRVELFSGNSRLQLIDGININSTRPWLRHKSTIKTSCAETTIPSSLKQTGSVSDFIACPDGPPARASSVYEPPAEPGVSIIEIMSNSRSCTSDDASDDCFDYVKLKNTSSTAVNLAALRLRTGSSGASATISTSFHWMQPTLHPFRDEYMLEPGVVFTITLRDDGAPLSITNDEGNVWIEDYFGIKTYQSVHYGGMGLSAANGKSWALDSTDGSWKLGVPSPHGANVIADQIESESLPQDSSSLKPCRDDQYRSEETNRCRSIMQANTLTPCKEGQYRSEETNRCRSIAVAAASVLKPCADDQFRSPDTNRCRKIVGSEDLALVDCGEGRERNPETNRCRNIVRSAPAPADFAIEPIKEPASVFVGWWILGGVTLLVVGYAGWEWREEIGQKIRRISQFIKAGH